MTGTGRLDVCLVAHFAYGALAGGDDGHVGGVERQTSLMARWLAARDHRVSLVTWDEGQRDGVTIDGVTVFKVCRRDAGVPGLRFFHPRWTSLAAALDRADARVYYQNCGEYVTGQVALHSRLRSRGFVYSVASDPECDPRLPGMKAHERVLYAYGLRRADRIVVQTRAQQAALRDGWGLTSEVIPLPCPGPERDLPLRASPAAGARVLWIGRVCEVKRPDRLLDVAAACPEIGFDLVGPSDGSAYARGVLDRASAVPNVTVHGRASRDAVPAFYRAAACLLNTSAYEGFPNTFIEAWSHALPVVSTVDPDGLIAERSLGAVAADVAGLASALRGLLAGGERWTAAASAARRQYVENHTVDAVMARFEAVFRAAQGMPAVAAAPHAPAVPR